MTTETDIDIEKSLKTGTLQIRPKWLELSDTIVFLALASALITSSLLLYGEINMANVNDRFFGYFILPFVILFGIILFYKKLTEKRLVKIDTRFDSRQNQLFISEFIKEQGFTIIKEDADIIIAVSQGDFAPWPKQINFLISGKAIYVCILTLCLKARVPSFFTGRSIVKNLRTFIKERAVLSKSICNSIA